MSLPLKHNSLTSAFQVPRKHWASKDYPKYFLLTPKAALFNVLKYSVITTFRIFKFKQNFSFLRVNDNLCSQRQIVRMISYLIDLSTATTKNKHAKVNYSTIKDSLRETGISVRTGKQIKSYSITKRALEANVSWF